MSDLCKKHQFGYEPMRLLTFGCPLCLLDDFRELQVEIDKLKEEIKKAYERMDALEKVLKG